jgi:hypothetical protein
MNYSCQMLRPMLADDERLNYLIAFVESQASGLEWDLVRTRLLARLMTPRALRARV